MAAAARTGAEVRVARRHVRRGRLGGRRGPGGRRRPRRRRRAPGAVAQPASRYRSGARGCCTHRGLPATPGGSPTCSASRSTCGTCPSGSQPTSSTTSSPSTPPGARPNPCLRCNERIKFAAVLDRRSALGFDAVCTGHYARLVEGPHGPRAAPRGRPGARTSPTCSASSTPSSSPRSHVPARRLAEGRGARRGRRDAGLAVAAKPDSHDICFIPDGDTAGFLQATARAPHPARSSTRRPATVVGAHDGALRASPSASAAVSAWASPHRTGPAATWSTWTSPSRRVSVGPATMLDVHRISRDPAPVVRAGVEGSAPLGVQVRAHGEEIPAVVTPDGLGLRGRAGQPAAGRGPRPGRRALRGHAGGGLGHDRTRGRVSGRSVGATGEPGVVPDVATAPASCRPGGGLACSRWGRRPRRPVCPPLTRRASTPARCRSGSPWARTRSASAR